MARTVHEQERLERSNRGNLEARHVPLDVGEYFQRLTMAAQVELVSLLRRELARETRVLEQMVAVMEEHGR
jgi:hypothetical protein